MSTHCPQCGAPLPAGEECRILFDRCLAKEMEQPTYYTAHHLLVLSYMLQHNGYSRAGWITSRKLLAEFVNDRLQPAHARQQMSRTVASDQRKWSITRGAKLAEVDQIRWHCTIADVRLDSAEHYCADVARWAAQILADTETLIESLANDDAAGATFK